LKTQVVANDSLPFAMRRRPLLLLPVAPAIFAAETPAPANPFAGLDRTIAADFPDIESVVVLRDNRPLFEYYKAGAGSDALRDVQSVTKSVVSIAVGVAIGKGILSSVDQSVPELVGRTATLSERAARTRLTFRHLLSMTAGFAPTGRVTRKQSDDPAFLLARETVAEPGTQFFYDNHASNLLASTLELAIREPLPKFTNENLFAPLGIRTPEWETGPNGHAYGASGLRLRTRDMALLGQLMLERGAWRGTQLLPAAYVAEATSPQSPGGAASGQPYGYGWWVRPSAQGIQTYFASGFGGQLIWVHVPLRLAIAVTSEVSERSHANGQALALIRNQLFSAASAWRPA
jgi:CubicO group peptidase (beta-lactamase class C family)